MQADTTAQLDRLSAALAETVTVLAVHPEFTRATLHHGELVTYHEAATRLGRPEATLRSWGLPAYGSIGRRNLVGWGDVVEAEHAARQPRPRPPYLTSSNRSPLRSA